MEPLRSWPRIPFHSCSWAEGLLGWANGGFAEETIFCIDNIHIAARSTFGDTTTG
jgi:hypothetical protein